MVDRHSTAAADSSAQNSASRSSAPSTPEPTLLETQLDSIALTLTKMKAKLSTAPSWEQLSVRERAELQVALSRVENRVHEVGRLIRRDSEAPLLHEASAPSSAEFSAHA